MVEAVGYAAIDCAHETLAEARPGAQARPALPAGRAARQHRARRALLARALPGRHPDPEPLRAVGARRAARPALGPGPARLRRPDRPRGQRPALRRRPLGPAERGPHPARAGCSPTGCVERVTLTELPRHAGATTGSSSTLGCDFADIFEVRGWRRARARAVLRARSRWATRWCSAIGAATAGCSGRVVRFRRPPDRAHRADRAMESARSRASAGRARVGGRTPTRRERPRGVVPAPRPRRAAAAPLDARLPRLARREQPLETDVDDFDALLHRAADDLRALYVEVDGDEGDLGRHPVVLHRLRPRLDHHLAADAAAPARASRATRCATWPAARACARTRTRRSSPARSSTSCAAARWRGAARSRTCPTTAASTRRRSGWCCCTRPGAGPATPRWCASCCRTRSGRSTWIDRFGDLDGDGFVEYARTSAQGAGQPGLEGLGRRRALPRRPAAGAADRAGRGPGLRLRRQGPDGRAVPARAGSRERAAALRREAAELQGPDPLRRSGSRSSAPSRSRSTGRSARCRTATTNAGHLLWSRVPTAAQGARRRDRAFSSPTSSPAGACAR